MTNPHDREPQVSRHGRAYASLLDENLLLHVREKSLFDLTEQDGHDLRTALGEVLDPKPSPSHQAAIEVVAVRLHGLAVRWAGMTGLCSWDAGGEDDRDYWRGQARELLADAAAHGTW
jgi:hypothetical protein